MNHNGDPTNRTRPGLRAALILTAILPVACSENTTAPSEARIAVSAHITAEQQTAIEQIAKDITTPEPSSTTTPEVVQPEIEYAESAEVEKDVQAMVTMIDAMDPFNREDIKVNTTGNPDGSYSQSFTKTIKNYSNIPTILTATIVYRPNVSGAAASTENIEALNFHIIPVNPDDFNLGGNASSMIISRVGDEDWAFNVSHNDFPSLQATTEFTPGKGADTRLRLEDEHFAIFELTSNIAALDAGIPFISAEVPAADPMSDEPVPAKVLPASL